MTTIIYDLLVVFLLCGMFYFAWQAYRWREEAMKWKSDALFANRQWNALMVCVSRRAKSKFRTSSVGTMRVDSKDIIPPDELKRALNEYNERGINYSHVTHTPKL